MNKPVAWMFEYGTDRGDAVNKIMWYPNVHFKKPDLGGLIRNIEPLYTHPHPDNLGLAESIIKQQQLKIDNLLENNARLDAEIEALKAHPVKELTDEKIDKIENAIYCKTIQKGKTQHEYIMAFARAILRKAQGT